MANISHAPEQVVENPPNAVEGIMERTRRGIADAAHGTVELTGHIGHFTVDASGHLLGRAGRAVVTGTRELIRGAMGLPFRKERTEKRA